MANVQIIKLGHVYNEGARGEKGGAASNDKVWGIAKIENSLVSFSGRRNGKLKFKTHLKGSEAKLNAKWGEKIGGRTDGGDIYTVINPDSAMASTLCPKLKSDVESHFYSDMAKGKLNTRH